MRKVTHAVYIVRFNKAMTRTMSNWIYIQIIGMACFNAQAGTWLICFQGSLINVLSLNQLNIHAETVI